MIPIFFFMLCIWSGSGDMDCSFEWEIIPVTEVRDQWTIYNEKEVPGNLGGFTLDEERRIFASDMVSLMHEIKHAICILQNQDPTLKELCHFKVDMDYTVQATHEAQSTPKPPLYTEQYAFENGLPLPNFYNMTQKDYDALVARNFK